MHPPQRAAIEFYRLVLAKDVGDSVRAESGPLRLEHVYQLTEFVLRCLVRHLKHQDGQHGRLARLLGVPSPPCLEVEGRLDSLPEQGRSEAALLVRFVESDLVLDQSGRPHLVDVDLDRWVVGSIDRSLHG